MADRSTGPVKPPVIDLTARNANAKPEERASTSEAPTAQPRRLALDLSDANWPLLGGVAVAGAVLGTVLTYLLAIALPRRFERLMTAELERRRLGPFAPTGEPVSAH